MRVLMLHNRYRLPGGEDGVVRAEAQMLRDHGVEVELIVLDNDAPLKRSETIRAGLASAWSESSREHVEKMCRSWNPDVAHVHNFWLRLSPSVHAACHAAGVPTVQSLHNFRLLCVNSLFLRDGKVCEDCLGKVPWRGIAHRCYKESAVYSGAVARMIVENRRRRTWQEMVDAFIVMSEFTRSKFVQGGLPADRILVKPNFVKDPGRASSPPSASNTVIYVGRLSPEKGLTNLIAAWAKASLDPPHRLLIVGDGPHRGALQRQAQSLGLREPEVTFTGWKDPAEVHDLLVSARALVLPTIWYEGGGCPVSVVEAMAAGRPVLISDIGGMREIVNHARNGLCIPAGDVDTLASALRRLLFNPAEADAMGAAARVDYDAKYGVEQNFHRLMRIYEFALKRAGKNVERATF